MDDNQMKVQWQGEVVSVQPRSNVWRYLTDNRTHRESGYNIFVKGEAVCDGEILQHNSGSDKYDFCVAISEKQETKIKITIPESKVRNLRVKSQLQYPRDIHVSRL